MIRSAVLSVAFLMALVVSPGCHAGTETGMDAVFETALQAARHGDWDALAEAEKKLPDDYPLTAYLDFHKLDSALPNLDPERIRAYAERYSDSPLPHDIRELALVAYVEADHLADARQVFDSAPRAVALKCYYLHARLPVDRDAVLAKAREIWLAGHSRPASCNPLFNEARQAGVIADDEVWHRMRLAFREGRPGLMRYLQPMLSAHQDAGDWLLRVYRHPQQITDLPKTIDGPERQYLIALALRRLAYTDTVAARKQFQHSRDQLGFSDPTLRHQAATRIAWYSIIRDIKENRSWQDHWLADSNSETLLSQRARQAIREQDWNALSHWIQRLPAEERADSRWLYWQGRAAAANGNDDQARQDWARAAQQRNYYGFLAADRLGQGYSFNNQAPSSSLPDVTAPAITRVTLLRRMGQPRLAWDEWIWLLWHRGEDQVRALAQLALDRGWNDLAVQASIQARAWNVLAWRFPPAYQDRFIAAGRQHDVDPWLAMAVSRRESAFYPQARSGAGAVGLMQLLPSTARLVARRNDQAAPSAEQLTRPATNIDLGVSYLSDLLERFNGNRVLALAAYNAGPGRVEDWLADPDEAVPADVWIASIPFHETRAYVQAVLAYRVLFVGLHDPDRHAVHLLDQQEASARYSTALINQDAAIPE